MKPLVVLILVSAFSVGYAQTEAPKKEFVIELTQDNIQLTANETRDVEIRINRSKAYLKSPATMGFSSSLPKGIEATFSPDKGTFETTTLTIKSGEIVEPGVYQVIVRAVINGKTKGAIVKLSVTDKAIASDSNK